MAPLALTNGANGGPILEPIAMPSNGTIGASNRQWIIIVAIVTINAEGAIVNIWVLPLFQKDHN